MAPFTPARRRLAGAISGIIFATACSDPAVTPDGSSASSADGSAAGAAVASETSHLISTADDLYDDGKHDSAAVLYSGALEQALLEGDRLAETEALTSLGLSAWRMGDYAAARQYGEEALDTKLELGFDDRLFRSYNALGLLAYHEYRYLAADSLYDLAHAAADAVADTASLAKVSNNRALLLIELGELAEAEELLWVGLEASRAVGNDGITGRVLVNIGMLAIQVGDPLSGIGFLEQAGPVIASAEDPIGEQQRLGHFGVAYAAIGNPGRAIIYLDSALAQSRSHGDRQDEASNLEQLAGIHRDAGDYTRALELYAQAQRIDEDLGLTVEMGANLRSEAEINAALGHHDLAVKQASRARNIHGEGAARFEELADLLLLAELSQASGDHERSTRHLEEADNLVERFDAATARRALALTRARLAESAGRPAEVIEVLRAAEADLSTGVYAARWEAEALAATAHARLGNLDDAAAAGRRAVAVIERTRGEILAGPLRTAYGSGRTSVYGHLVNVLLALGRPEEAFEVADASRGRAMLDHFASRSSRATRTSPRSLAEQILAQQRQIDSLATWIDESGGPSEAPTLVAALNSLRQAASEKQVAYDEALERAPTADPVASGLAGRGSSARDVRRTLMPDEALLQYTVMPDRVLLFVATPAWLRTFEAQVDRSTLAARIRIVRDLVSTPDAESGAARGALSALYDELVGPAAEALAGVRRLIIVPHEELVYLPFAALYDRDTGRHLVQDYSIAHMPSSASVVTLRSDPARSAVTTAASAFAPFPRELPGTRAEVEAIDRTVHNSRTYVGRSATEATLRSALGRDDVIHVASHGALNALNPMFSRIELAPGSDDGAADDGRLELHELVGLPVASQLVFLSGCDTGLGIAHSTRFAPGEDYATLAQAFLYAGARAVVATLWKVEDEGAATFAETFYRYLGDHPAGDALAMAQRDMLAGSEWASPYHWAGFRLSGSDRSGQLALKPQEPTFVSVLP